MSKLKPQTALEELREGETEQGKIFKQLKLEAQKEAFKIIEEDKRFVKLKTGLLHTISKLPRNCLTVLIYLRGYVNRDTGYKDTAKGREYHKVWLNLDRYYNEGYLVTAKTQERIAEQIGIDQGQVSIALRKLIELNYIWDFGYETYRGKSGKIKRMNVFCLGFLIQTQNKMVEVYLHERGIEKQIEIEEEDDF